MSYGTGYEFDHRLRFLEGCPNGASACQFGAHGEAVNEGRTSSMQGSTKRLRYVHLKQYQQSKEVLSNMVHASLPGKNSSESERCGDVVEAGG